MVALAGRYRSSFTGRLILALEKTMTIICGICGVEHHDFRRAWGHWCDHLAAGDEMVDWIEIPKSLLEEKKE